VENNATLYTVVFGYNVYCTPGLVICNDKIWYYSGQNTDVNGHNAY